MAKTMLKQVRAHMKGIDLCMLTTVDGRGVPSSRPMSNNGEVDYDGTSYFFTWKKSRMVREIKKNAQVGLEFVNSTLLKKTFLSVKGKAKLIDDKEKMREHWNKDIEIWFEDGLDTPGIVMIEVKAKFIKFLSNAKEGEVTIK